MGRWTLADLPPALELTLEDRDTYDLIVEAACDVCKSGREIGRPDALRPELFTATIADLFADGKIRCGAHGRRPAIWLAIALRERIMGERQVVGVWHRSV